MQWTAIGYILVAKRGKFNATSIRSIIIISNIYRYLSNSNAGNPGSIPGGITIFICYNGKLVTLPICCFFICGSCCGNIEINFRVFTWSCRYADRQHRGHLESYAFLTLRYSFQSSHIKRPATTIAITINNLLK